MKQLVTGVVAALAMGVMAEITNTVEVTKFHQSYPYSGKATVEYTVGGALPANAVAEITLNTDDASATFVQSNIVTGANSHVIDFASSFGGALLLTNASFVVTIAEDIGFAGAVAVGVVTYGLAAPVISPESGMTFANSLTVSISCEVEDATIYYTSDGSEPTKNSTEYLRKFKIYGKTTVKAVAYDAASDLYSGVTTADYALGTCANPVIAPEGGSAEATEGGYVFYRDGQTVTIDRNGEEGTIRYTLDGTDPTAESAAYSGAITLDATTTVKAKVFSDNYFDSEVVTVTFFRDWMIGDVMGAPYHAFTTSGDDGKAFYRVVDASAPNGAAMHSGDIGNSGAYGSFARTVLSTTVMGAGTVGFSWKASCEDDAPAYEWDHGEFAVDGVVEAYVGGETGWTNVSVAVSGSGEHTLTWTYLKDDAESEGEDCIWVAGYGWASAETYTHTTVVPVPYAWLVAHDPDVVDEYEAYEAAAKKMAANGGKVWECYALGLDPQVATNDFRIASFPMKADGTPDLANVAFDPPREQWNVPDAPVVWKGAAQLEGPWRTVTSEGGSPGTARPTTRFFKAVVFGDEHDMVQLWENGPYWATTNIGAEDPWEYGYYFWWVDTVGYTNTGKGWISVKDGTEIQFTSSGTAGSTGYKDNSALLEAGYIDETGNLAAAYDAATAHLGSPWRMPTDAEFSALISNCTTTWITTNGVSGLLVTGMDEYANRSIFLPATGDGYESRLYYNELKGVYWSSTPNPDYSSRAWYLYFDSYSSKRDYENYYRYYGRPIRPVRGFTQ